VLAGPNGWHGWQRVLWAASNASSGAPAWALLLLQKQRVVPGFESETAQAKQQKVCQLLQQTSCSWSGGGAANLCVCVLYDNDIFNGVTG
jgi:hypothetical protein